MSWNDYLKKDANTKVREDYLRHRLATDVILNAADKGYHIDVMIPNVDLKGVDVILSCDDADVSLQLKSKWDSTTNKWKMKRKFCLPAEQAWSNISFGFSSILPIRDHAFVMLDVKATKNNTGSNTTHDATNHPVIEYYIFDHQVLFLHRIGVLKRSAKSNKLERLIDSIYRGRGKLNSNIEVPQTAMLKMDVKTLMGWLLLPTVENDIPTGSIDALLRCCYDTASIGARTYVENQWNTHVSILADWFDARAKKGLMEGYVIERPSFYKLFAI